MEYYEAGHMMYCHEPSRLAQSQHLAEFVGGIAPAPTTDDDAPAEATSEH
ncbi:hypothetical protein [Brachybacterium muris]|nr:hypothetical protein [Brachybacterium muris]MCT1654097.1 hypothetical protein [Brachybacterium muris]